MGRTGAIIDASLANLEPWISGGEPVESAEALALRMVIEHRFRSQAEYEASLETLLGRQNTDGGWGWLDGEASDPLATGQVLYFLARTGFADPAPIRAAWTFLRDSQQDNGSWTVQSTKKDVGAALYTSNQWGTGWAAIGILSTLPGDAP
jgi:hypothetical protein